MVLPLFGGEDMHISTNDQMELCGVVADKIAEIATKQGKKVDAGHLFELMFGGDHCDIFDAILGEIK